MVIGNLFVCFQNVITAGPKTSFMKQTNKQTTKITNVINDHESNSSKICIKNKNKILSGNNFIISSSVAKVYELL